LGSLKRASAKTILDKTQTIEASELWDHDFRLYIRKFVDLSISVISGGNVSLYLFEDSEYKDYKIGKEFNPIIEVHNISYGMMWHICSVENII
jgi:hypothetical protein